ncbi:hypothetical protein GEMRC1_007038 [Eukaryota sp. GEM-RC1]
MDSICLSESLLTLIFTKHLEFWHSRVCSHDVLKKLPPVTLPQFALNLVNTLGTVSLRVRSALLCSISSFLSSQTLAVFNLRNLHELLAIGRALDSSVSSCDLFVDEHDSLIRCFHNFLSSDTVRSITYGQLSSTSLPPLLHAYPNLQRVTAMCGFTGDFDKFVDSLVQLSQLSTLSLSFTSQFTNECLSSLPRFFASSKSLPILKEVILCNVPLNLDCGPLFDTVFSNTRVQKFKFTNSLLTKHCLESLLLKVFQTSTDLKELIISNCVFEWHRSTRDIDFSQLIPALSQQSNLKKLEWSFWRGESTGPIALHVIKSIKFNKSLAQISLAGICPKSTYSTPELLSDSFANELTAIVNENDAIKYLDISVNKFLNLQFSKFCKSLESNTTLIHLKLDLYSCEQVITLVNCLKTNTVLSVVDLNDSSIAPFALSILNQLVKFKNGSLKILLDSTCQKELDRLNKGVYWMDLKCNCACSICHSLSELKNRNILKFENVPPYLIEVIIDTVQKSSIVNQLSDCYLVYSSSEEFSNEFLPAIHSMSLKLQDQYQIKLHLDVSKLTCNIDGTCSGVNFLRVGNQVNLNFLSAQSQALQLSILFDSPYAGEKPWGQSLSNFSNLLSIELIINFPLYNNHKFLTELSNILNVLPLENLTISSKYSLDFSNGFFEFCSVMETNNSIKVLDLSNSFLTPESFQKVVSILESNSTLEKLILKQCLRSNHHVSPSFNVLPLIENSSLKELSFNECFKYFCSSDNKSMGIPIEILKSLNLNSGLTNLSLASVCPLSFFQLFLLTPTLFMFSPILNSTNY